jgi:hypothetical protein
MSLLRGKTILLKNPTVKIYSSGKLQKNLLTSAHFGTNYYYIQFTPVNKRHSEFFLYKLQESRVYHSEASRVCF